MKPPKMIGIIGHYLVMMGIIGMILLRTTIASSIPPRPNTSGTMLLSSSEVQHGSGQSYRRGDGCFSCLYAGDGFWNRMKEVFDMPSSETWSGGPGSLLGRGRESGQSSSRNGINGIMLNGNHGPISSIDGLFVGNHASTDGPIRSEATAGVLSPTETLRSTMYLEEAVKTPSVGRVPSVDRLDTSWADGAASNSFHARKIRGGPHEGDEIEIGLHNAEECGMHLCHPKHCCKC